MILEKKTKKLTIPVIFKREALNHETLKTISAYFESSLTFEVSKDEMYESHTLTLLLGHSGYTDSAETPHLARTLKVFLEDGNGSIQEISWCSIHGKTDGVKITRSETEVKLTPKQVVEKLNSGKYKLFDSEKLELSNLG